MQKYNVGDKVVFKKINGSNTYEELWSGYISEINNKWYTIMKDGVIVPEVTRNNVHFTYPYINLHFFQDAFISPYIDKEGDDERRRAWPEVNAARNVQIQILQKQIDDEKRQFDDNLFSQYQIGEKVDYWDDSEDFPSGACGGIISFSGIIIGMDRMTMNVVVRTNPQNNDSFLDRIGDIYYLKKI